MDENKTATQESVAGTSPANGGAESADPAGKSGETGMADDEEVMFPENWKPDDSGTAETPDKVSPEDKNLFELFGVKQDGTTSVEGTEPKAENVPKETETPKEEPAPDYKAMYEALLHSTQDSKNRDTFRQVYAEQKAAGMSDAAARLVAKDAAGGKEFSLTDEADASGKAGQPDYAAALNQLHSVAPELKEIPAEVTKAIMDGGDAVSAYMGWQRAQDRKTIGELRAKIADMEKKAANTVQAVARGVSASGAKQNADDDFLKGMMAEDW